jgi:DNA-binding transcriptional MocR family regulator
MLGHPKFREVLARFLEKQYAQPVDWKTLMSTAGSSMALDLALRVHCKVGDVAVVEEPTYMLAFSMIRDRGMDLMGVPMEKDGMDLNALEKLLEDNPGKIRIVYTIPVHHNPTGYTMSEEKRKRLVALAQKYNFLIAADEAYQLLNFEKIDCKPMFYYDDPNDPRVFSIGTFSKLIGPGLKVGWIQAHEPLLKPLAGIGFIDSGNNPVTFSSCNLIDFIESGALEAHITFVCDALGKRCALICMKLREVGLEVDQPKGGYFVWVKSKGKMTGKSGESFCIRKDRFHDWMRLSFGWLSITQIEEGIEFLRQ